MLEIGDLFVVLVIAFCACAGIPVARMNRRDQPRRVTIMLMAAIALAFGFAITNFGFGASAIIGAFAVSFLMTLGYFNARRRLLDQPGDSGDK
jgi:hypothetical protein